MSWNENILKRKIKGPITVTKNQKHVIAIYPFIYAKLTKIQSLSMTRTFLMFESVRMTSHIIYVNGGWQSQQLNVKRYDVIEMKTGRQLRVYTDWIPDWLQFRIILSVKTGSKCKLRFYYLPVLAVPSNNVSVLNASSSFWGITWFTLGRRNTSNDVMTIKAFKILAYLSLVFIVQG